MYLYVNIIAQAPSKVKQTYTASHRKSTRGGHHFPAVKNLLLLPYRRQAAKLLFLVGDGKLYLHSIKNRPIHIVKMAWFHPCILLFAKFSRKKVSGIYPPSKVPAPKIPWICANFQNRPFVILHKISDNFSTHIQVAQKYTPEPFFAIFIHFSSTFHILFPFISINS